jgi:hypothetical protein
MAQVNNFPSFQQMQQFINHQNKNQQADFTATQSNYMTQQVIQQLMNLNLDRNTSESMLGNASQLSD